MKFLPLILSAFLFITACSDKKDDKQSSQSSLSQNVETLSADFSDKVFHFNLDATEQPCSEKSEIVCTINLAIQCTLNPKLDKCLAHKNNMPNFIFMEDEFLGRPTELSYQIMKIKPLPNNQYEVFTLGTCNGNWFGLCNGKIIYVMKNDNDNWSIVDIYAIENS